VQLDERFIFGSIAHQRGVSGEYRSRAEGG